MESTEVSEKRFERTMDRLFPGSPSTPAASSAGVPSPVKKKKEGQQVISVRAPQSAGGSAPLSGSHGCRPWDRGDLLRRLSTYKSISWFGKPKVAGPVACARRGWVNVDVDLLGCETCGSRLSFPIPPSWSLHQAESAALSFAEQLDTGHKGLCAWRNNPCAETLAQFPPKPLPVLRGAYTDRCDALSQLSSLPVISEAAINQMKLTRALQVDNLLSEPSPSMPGVLPEIGVGSSSTDNEPFATNKTFYQAQRIVAVCGWEPRLLPYTVDCEDRSGVQSVNGHVEKARDPGPSVTVHSRADVQVEAAKSQVDPLKAGSADPRSAVLDCSLCGASVGLWKFNPINRPAPLLVSGLEGLLAPKKKAVESGTVRISTASSVDGLISVSPEASQGHAMEAVEAAQVNASEKITPQKGVLDLKLTIAGGPPPTRLSAPALVPPTFGISGLPPVGLQPKRSVTATYAAASYASREPEYQENGTDHGGSTLETAPYTRPIPADSVEGKVVDDREADDVEESKDAGTSFKRKRETASSEPKHGEGGHYSENTKRKREVGSQWQGVALKRPARDLPHASSVNAVDTRYLQKQENSMESVDNLLQESDGQGTTIGEEHGDGPDFVVQAEHSRCHQDALEADKSKSDGGVDEGAGTNLAVISTGTVTGVSAGLGGGGSVGIGASRDAEVRGVGDNLERTESVADFVTDVTGIMEEFVPGRGLMDEFVPEETEKVNVKYYHGESQDAMLGISHTFVKGSSSAGASERSQGSHREADENANAGSTFDTRNAVIQGDVMDARIQVKEVTDGHMAGESPPQVNEEVQSPARFPPGLPLEDVVKLEPRTGEFDPIHQHRHFCPWVNGHVAAAASSTSTGGLCGWQITLDALQQQNPLSRLQQSDSAASKYKDNPLLSVRKVFGRGAPKQLPRN